MSKPIKLCFVCPKAYPLFVPEIGGIFGGAEVDLYILGNALANDNIFEVSFVVGDYGQADEEIIGNVRLFKSLRSGGKSLFAPFKIWRALKRADADVYMLETMSPGLIMLWLYHKFSGKKYVFRTAHTNHCDGTYLRKHKLTSFMYRLAMNDAATIITQNKSDNACIQRIYKLEAVVIPNAHKIKNIIRKKGNYILWVARSAAFKNPYMFVRLAKSLPKHKFIMICPPAFDDTNYDELKSAAKNAENLEFISGLSFEQTQAYFENARLFVNTSDSEGFPNTFVQASMVGVPIVSYKINPDGFLDVNNCGRCARGSYQRLVEIVAHFADDENLNVQLGNNAFKYADKNHNIDKIAPLYADIFKRIASNDN